MMIVFHMYELTILKFMFSQSCNLVFIDVKVQKMFLWHRKFEMQYVIWYGNHPAIRGSAFET